MKITDLLFIFCSIFLIFSSLMVVLINHIVFNLLFLVCCFLLSAFLLILLECEFLAFIFIIIYVGAIAVLFLFAIMMLESKETNLSKTKLNCTFLSFFVVIFLFCQILNVLFNKNFSSLHFDSSNVFFIMESTRTYENWYDIIYSITDIEVYGKVLYHFYVVHLITAGFILLLVLISVIYLTNIYPNATHNKQSIYKQLTRNSKFFNKD